MPPVRLEPLHCMSSTLPQSHYAPQIIMFYLIDVEKYNEQCIRQGSHRLEKYLNLEGFLEKSLKIRYALKSTEKSLKGLEKSLNSSIFCRTYHC